MPYKNIEDLKEYGRKYRIEHQGKSKQYYIDNRDKKLQYRKQYHVEHREQEIKKNKQWREDNPEYGKQWYIANREQRLEQLKEYYKTHKKQVYEQKEKYRRANLQQISEYYKQYRKLHPKQAKCSIKKWRERNVGKVREMAKRNRNKRRRNMGFEPLNNYFKNSAAHHLDETYIIYMPKIIHQRISHCLETGRNMREINRIAMNFLEKNEKGKEKENEDGRIKDYCKK